MPPAHDFGRHLSRARIRISPEQYRKSFDPAPFKISPLRNAAWPTNNIVDHVVYQPASSFDLRADYLLRAQQQETVRMDDAVSIDGLEIDVPVFGPSPPVQEATFDPMGFELAVQQHVLKLKFSFQPALVKKRKESVDAEIQRLPQLERQPKRKLLRKVVRSPLNSELEGERKEAPRDEDIHILSPLDRMVHTLVLLGEIQDLPPLSRQKKRAGLGDFGNDGRKMEWYRRQEIASPTDHLQPRATDEGTRLFWDIEDKELERREDILGSLMKKILGTKAPLSESQKRYREIEDREEQRKEDTLEDHLSKILGASAPLSESLAREVPLRRPGKHNIVVKEAEEEMQRARRKSLWKGLRMTMTRR
jgi:hypothetical protein